MPKLETLFQNHLNDLKDIVPSTKDIFFCPICLLKYSFNDIKNKKLSRGDVWSKYIREKCTGSNLKSQIVLLCKRCNSQAGQYGDSQMQLFEQVKDGDNTGNLYGMRPITLTVAGDDPIFINANISIKNDTKRITISGKLDNDAKLLNDKDAKSRQKNNGSLSRVV